MGCMGVGVQEFKPPTLTCVRKSVWCSEGEGCGGEGLGVADFTPPTLTYVRKSVNSGSTINTL